MNPIIQNSGALIKSVYGTNIATFTAGTTYDNVGTTLTAIDRSGYDSCVLATFYNGSIADTKEIDCSFTISDSADGVTYGTPATLLPLTAIYKNTSGSTATPKGVYSQSLDLLPYKRYIQIVATTDLSNTGTDTAAVSHHVILGGSKVIPAV